MLGALQCNHMGGRTCYRLKVLQLTLQPETRLKPERSANRLLLQIPALVAALAIKVSRLAISPAKRLCGFMTF
jgi:hypothetical protein